MKRFAQRPEASVVVTAILLALFFAISTKGIWLQSIPSVLRLTATVGTVAIGQALLMTSGEVDLSVGSVFAVIGIVFVEAMNSFGLGVAPAIIVALLAACAIGFINAVFTVRLNIPSMIVTLGAMFVFRGLAYLGTGGQSLSIPSDFRHDPIVQLFQLRFSGLSASVVLLFLLTAIFVFIFARTRLGSHLHAVGGNAAAALANGVSPAAVKTRAFILCSALAGLSAIVAVCQDGSIYGTSGLRMELETVAAAVIGGCSLRGGVGSVWGAILGVFVLASLKGGLMMLGAPTSWYIAFVGAVLIGFLVSTTILRRRLGVAI